MARKRDIVENAPEFMKMNLLDLIMELDPSKTNKYTPLMVKIFSENYIERNMNNTEEFDYLLNQEYNIPNYKDIQSECVPLYSHLLNLFRPDFVKSCISFVDAAEKNQIPGLDISKISKISEITEIMSIIKLKSISKKLQTQVLKDYEDEEWLILRPFTHEASVKYGYGTKWCTSAENYAEHFFSYTRDGKLIYCINKITGKKVAVFQGISGEKINELSFWNSADERTDSMICGLPNKIMDEVKHILFSKDLVPNRLLNEKVWNDSRRLQRDKFEKEVQLIRPEVVDMTMDELPIPTNQWTENVIIPQ